MIFELPDQTHPFLVAAPWSGHKAEAPRLRVVRHAPPSYNPVPIGIVFRRTSGRWGASYLPVVEGTRWHFVQALTGSYPTRDAAIQAAVIAYDAEIPLERK